MAIRITDSDPDPATLVKRALAEVYTVAVLASIYLFIYKHACSADSSVRNGGMRCTNAV